MLNVVETLEKIMEEYSLNKTMLSRATGYEYSSINRWCNGVRKPDIDTLEDILNYFGYGLKVDKLVKEIQTKPSSFFLKKSYNQLKEMNTQDLADYVFATQGDDVVSWVTKVDEDVLEYIPVGNQRELIRNKIKDINRLGLYFKINKMYPKVEEDAGIFIEAAKEYFEENFIAHKKEVFAKAKYLLFNVTLEYDDGFEYYSTCNYQLLDENRSLLDLSGRDMHYFDLSGFLDEYFSEKLGNYLFDFTTDDYSRSTACEVTLTY